MAPTRIAVAGFTSRLAILVTRNLLQKANVEVVGICRDPKKVPIDIAEDPRVQTSKAEYTDSTTLREALKGVSACVCCYHGAEALMVEGQRILIDACIAESVPRYLASDFSFDFRRLKIGEFPFKDVQIIINDLLQKKEDEGQIQPVHILVGGFMEAILTPFMGILDPASKKMRYWGTGDEKWDMTCMEDVAKFTAEVANDPNAIGVLNIQGDSKSIKEMGRIFENQYGVSLTYERLGSLEDLGKAMVSARKEKPQEPFSWLGMHYNYFTIKGSTLLQGSDHTLYPNFQRESLATLCTKHGLEELPDLYAGVMSK